MDNVFTLAEAAHGSAAELKAYVESLGYKVDDDGYIDVGED